MKVTQRTVKTGKRGRPRKVQNLPSKTKGENVYLFLLRWVESKCINTQNVSPNLD